MEILKWIFWYLVSCLTMFLLAAVTRKNGYGETFPSAMSAAIFNLFWPIVVIFMGAVLFFEWLGPTWEKVEDWWDGPVRTKYDD